MRIAIIEDNESVANGIAYRMQDRGHATDIIDDGQAAVEFLRTDDNDIVILDIALPKLDGLSILRAMRARGDDRPVLLLTARATTSERVAGLNAGADDYLVKPFQMDELEARINALSRRVSKAVQRAFTAGTLHYYPERQTAMIGDRPVDLTRRELSLLDAFLRSGEGIMSKTDLIEALYGTGADVGETAIEAHVSRLRKKVAPAGLQIRTLRNIGYALQERSE